MAVVLPTLTVTDAQGARITAAFGADQATAVQNYKDWLAAAVINFVLAHETEAVIIQNSAALQASIDSIKASLPPIPTNVVLP